MTRKSRSDHDERLPTQRDFDPWGYLDAAEAWQNFGGLSIVSASQRFAENPLRDQEDFMFMGSRAFAYYFPVIESHLTGPFDIELCGDREAWILAHGIMLHFEYDDFESIRPLLSRILDLAESVLGNIHAFGRVEAERERVTAVWTELKSRAREMIEK